MQIILKDLVKKYGDLAAVDAPHPEIPAGQVVGFVGNNGAGKTMLLRLVLDLVQAAKGHVLLGGERVDKTTGWKSHTGSYLDEGFLIDFLNPEEYFSFVGKAYGMSLEEIEEAESRCANLFTEEVLGTGKLIRDLSAGNRKKVGLLAALPFMLWALCAPAPKAHAQTVDQAFASERYESGRDAAIASHALHEHRIVTDSSGLRIECVFTEKALFDANARAGTDEAFRRLLHETPVAAGPGTLENAGDVAGDRAALVALYEATDGPNWTDNTNWLTDAPLGEWYRVYTNAAGRVKLIQLWDNNLSGPIPPELGQLTNLEQLALNANALKGPIPSELRDLEKMAQFGINGNPEVCLSSDSDFTTWLINRFSVSFFSCERSEARLLPTALMREDSHGLALKLYGDLRDPVEVTVSDPSVAAVSAVAGWLELTPRGLGVAEVTVVPPGGGEPAVAAVKVRPAVGTFGIDVVLQQPAPINYEETLVASADWWSSVLDGTEFPDRMIEIDCQRQGENIPCGVKALADDMLIYALTYDYEQSGAPTGYASSYNPDHEIPIGGLLGMAFSFGGSQQIVVHEIGHHLGLVGLYPAGLLSEDSQYYIGARAVAAYRAGGGDASLPGVPVRPAHWGIYVNDWVMGGGNDMSVSLGSLVDAGYDVDTNAGFPRPHGVVQVALSASPNPVPEGADVTVTATLSKAVPRMVTIPLKLASDDAEEGNYVALNAIEIMEGHTSGAGAIRTVKDDDMDDETFTVALGTLPSGVLAKGEGVEITISENAVTSAEGEIPLAFALAQNYPNPFNPSTTITYALDRSGPVELSVYDMLGRVVQNLVDGVQPAGSHEVRFDAAGLPTGTYAYRLRAGTETRTRTMILIR